MQLRYSFRLYPDPGQQRALVAFGCARLVFNDAVRAREVARAAKDPFPKAAATCSTCGVKDGPNPLNVREWTCAACGTVHDRDHNAALTVKTAAGLAVSTCQAPVRPGAIPAQREETGSHGFPTQARAA
ncbi:helix-turn-helix domain-containing protein [Streptomyces sp. NPDC048508]|uniref:helix-turn-helix domain-containing protein n=1 Tax=Streptomyces sp. NPDC048508 TaxID=3365561 RepID=UPI003715BD9D